MNWTISAASREFSIDSRVLRARLRAEGHDDKRGARFPTAVILQAVVGSLERERIRETKARADLAEQEHARLAGDLMPTEDVKKLIAESLGPVRAALLALPSTAATRCNPTDPPHARAVLTECVDNILRIGAESVAE